MILSKSVVLAEGIEVKAATKGWRIRINNIRYAVEVVVTEAFEAIHNKSARW